MAPPVDHQLVEVVEVTLHPDADHHQVSFYDEDAPTGTDGGWSDADEAWMLAFEPGQIALGPARENPVPVTFAYAPARPEVDLGPWDHAVEFGVSLPSGRIVVFNSSETDEDVRLGVPPGDYGFLFLAGGLDIVDEGKLDGDDRYRVVLWPGEVPDEPRVLKRAEPA
jgi:hypothetical protein